MNGTSHDSAPTPDSDFPVPTSSHKNTLTRREFLSIAAATSASFVLAGCAPDAIATPTVAAVTTPGKISQTANDLNYLSATQLLEMFRAKKVSPVEVLQAHIKRAGEVKDKVNSFTYTHFDEAMQAAKESEQRYMQGNPRPLEGIPVALKDEHGKTGWTITMGSKLLKDNVVHENHPVTQKLMDAGAVLHAQTTVPELYVAAVTWSDLWGVTRNPWNLYYAVGGSSGGSGASLAAGTTTLATGSDMGGSIRIPAAFNGVYGFKPPFSRIAPDPGSTFMPQASDGPLARTFSDLVLLQNILAGPAPHSPTSLRPKLELPANYENIKGWRIAFDMDQGWAEVDPEIRKNTQAALKILEGQGAIIEEVHLELKFDDLYQGLLKALLSGAFGADIQDISIFSDELTTYGRAIAKIAGEMGPKTARDALQVAIKTYAALQDKRLYRK